MDPLSASQKLPDCGITDRRIRCNFHDSAFFEWYKYMKFCVLNLNLLTIKMFQL